MEILLVFAAAFIQLTEKWFGVPYNPERSLPMVCNLRPLAVRTYAW